MTDRLADLLANLFAFDVTADLLRRDFVQQALLAAALLALLAGLIGPFIVMRQMSFAVHGSSELSLTGAAFALLAGFNVGVGALVGCALAAILFGILGQRARERDSAIGVVLAFGLGLAVLFIHLYPGRTGTSFALLTGQIVGVGYSGLALLAVVTVLVVAVLAASYRPLLFATVDPDVAAGRGVPVRALGIVFAALVGVTAAQGVQIVGALLVMSLLITPAAAAVRVFVSPVAAIAASVVFAEISAVGGIVLSLAPGVPVSVFVTTISFAIFLVCWLIGRRGATSTSSAGPVATGRSGSELHSDHEPGYSAASTPTAASAATATDAVMPEPQYTPKSVSPCSLNSRASSVSSRNTPPSASRLVLGRFCAPGMWPATGSTGSTSPRNRSGARASSKVLTAAACCAVNVLRAPAYRSSWETTTSPGVGSTISSSRTPPAACHAARPPSRMRTPAMPAAVSTHQARAEPARAQSSYTTTGTPSRTPQRRAAAPILRPDGSGCRPRPVTLWSVSSSSSETYTAPGMCPFA